MLQLPIFKFLRVLNYGLFPGRQDGNGLEWAFEDGLSLIAGVNGLGKTTLLTMLLRCLTGPYDLTGDGVPDSLESILPPEPVSLKPAVRRFFKQRVADQAATATVELRASFGTKEIEITRDLSDLGLVRLSVNGSDQTLTANRVSRERSFQQIMCNLFGLGSFVDVLLILHHIIFFTEDRPGALWDENAQRQILRALFLDTKLANEVASFEREVGSADSQARNFSSAVYSLQQQVQKAREREKLSPGVSADYALEQKLLDAEMEERERLNTLLGELDERRREIRRQLEYAKLERERSENTVEELKFAVVARLFPKMADSARLVILKTLAGGECLVCGAAATQRRNELEALLAKGYCPACGAEPNQQEHVVAPFEVERARVKLARKAADVARTEEAAMNAQLVGAAAQYDEALARLEVLRQSISDRTNRTRRLSTMLPIESEEISRLQDALEQSRRLQKDAESERARWARKLTVALEKGRPPIERKTKQLSADFRVYAGALMSENMDLVRVIAKARITQGKESFEVPAFRPEMTAADRPGLARRDTPSDVSESQRELIDLAFRLALIKLTTGNASCSFVMETPEASLDELAMSRVGAALHEFSSHSHNRLIVTSNLTNAGMISSMFGGATRSATKIKERKKRVLNLLDVAAPNSTVLKHRASYQGILASAIAGEN